MKETVEEDAFIEHFARLLEQDGGPRIAGRIAALLLLSPDALALDEIAERLQASKASISTNARNAMGSRAATRGIGNPARRVLADRSARSICARQSATA